MTQPFTSPLKADEFVELDELLAQFDDDSLPMDASEADGFLTALCLLPNEVSPMDWMPIVFNAPIQNPRNFLSLSKPDFKSCYIGVIGRLITV